METTDDIAKTRDELIAESMLLDILPPPPAKSFKEWALSVTERMIRMKEIGSELNRRKLQSN